MSYLDWKVDDKVVCVKVGEWSGSLYPIHRAPEYGEVYTISGFIKDDDGVFLRLSEFPGRDVFLIERFRRVQTRKTDISIFERIRDNPKAPIIEPSPKQRERVS